MASHTLPRLPPALWVVLACLELVYVGHLVTRIGPHGPFTDGVYNVLIVASAALCLLRAARFRAERGAWLAVGLGMAGWAAGDVYWSAALAQLDEPPYPSWADAGYLLFYPGCYVGMVLLLRARGTAVARSLWLDGVVAALSVGAVAAAVVLPPIVEGSLDGDVQTVAVTLAYPVGDVLLLAILIGMSSLLGWRPDRTWAWLGIGLVAAGVADIQYLAAVASGTYDDRSVTTALWPAACLATAYAAWQPPGGRGTVRVSGLRVLVVPGTFTLAAFGVLVLDHFAVVNHTAAALASLTLLAVFVRAALTFKEHQALLGRTEHEARTDALTGLRNRRSLTLDLDARRGDATPARPLLLLLFDLNGFKAYNDAFGHPAGDALLARLGRRLDAATAAAGARGTAYRMGGDEFCVLARVTGDEVPALVAACLEALSEHGEGFEITAAHGEFLLEGPQSSRPRRSARPTGACTSTRTAPV